MSAPVIWILVPFIAAIALMFLQRGRGTSIQGVVLCLTLAAIALIIPIDTALTLGPFSIKIAGSVQLLGRSFQFTQPDEPILALIFGLAALWFFGTEAAEADRRFIPLGLGIIALLIASLAVEPFLYAALLIEIAALLAIPLLVNLPSVGIQTADQSHRGVLRFLIYQTLAMPFILFSGWMLAGVEASPGDLALTAQSGLMLVMGFAFLLAIFPLYNWIPMVAEESSPYILGFLLWLLPTFAMILALGFLDRYAWMRTSVQLTEMIRLAGLVLVVSGGWFAAFQRHLGRMMAYAAVAETGLAIIAVSLQSTLTTDLVFLLFIPRGLNLAVWALGLSIIKGNLHSLHFDSLQGLARSYPLATTGVILAHLSMAGLPLLAGFPPRLALWEQLAQISLGLAAWLLVGFFGLLVGAFRSLSVLCTTQERIAWQWKETRIQDVMLITGVFLLLALGLFPQLMQPLLRQLPAMFEHLAQ